MDKLQVVEFEGLAPSVFCSLFFADAGSKVTIIARPQSAPFSMPIQANLMNRNKKCVCLSVKDKNSNFVIKQYIKNADIIIDPFRPGVLEKLSYGPQQVWSYNHKAIFLRVAGYGQTGPMSMRPGHDLNYLAVGKILLLLNIPNYKVLNESVSDRKSIQFPMNHYADFLVSSLGIPGILLALIERKKTGKGQIIDLSLAEGSQYYAQFIQKQMRNSQKPQQYVKYIQRNGKLYCVTSKSLKKVNQFNEQHLEYVNIYKKIEKDDIQISYVRQVPNFDQKQYPSPFHRETQEKLSGKIPQRGQHNLQQIKKRGFSISFIKQLSVNSSSKL